MHQVWKKDTFQQLTSSLHHANVAYSSSLVTPFNVKRFDLNGNSFSPQYVFLADCMFFTRVHAQRRKPQSCVHDSTLIPLSLECHILLDYVWLKPGVGHSFTVICLEVLPRTAAVWHRRHIERIRGINAYSLACSISPWQVCGGAWVNRHVGASVLSNPAWDDGRGFVVSDQSCPGTLLDATQRSLLIFTNPCLYPDNRL